MLRNSIEPPRDRQRLMRMVLTVVIVFGILGIAFWAFLRTTGSPGFYKLMPWLNEYVASWSHSSHKEVPCRTCHFGPGTSGDVRTERVGIALVVQRLTGTGNTSAFRHVNAEGCTANGCHADLLKGGAILWHGVRFSHSDHLGKIKRGITLSCTTCHQSLVHGTGAHVVNTSSCTICHFKNLGWSEDIARCQLCHDVKKLAKARYNHKLVLARKIPCLDCHADVNRGKGRVDRNRCVACHTAGKRVGKYSDFSFVHKTHVTGQGFPCTFCHETIEHKDHPLSIASSDDCTVCHRQAHVATRSLYMGVNAASPGAGVHPDAMAAVHVHCQGCHTSWKRRRDVSSRHSSAASCNSCHGPGYDKILRQWSRMLRHDLGAARTAVSGARAVVASSRSAAAKEDLRVAAAMLRQVEIGHGQHNIVFAAIQLDGAVIKANAALRAAGSRTSFPRIEDAKKLTANECARCHLNPPATVMYKGKPFPHGKHIAAVGDCESCHTPYSSHGKLSWGKEACATCHGGVPLPHPAHFRSKMRRYVKKAGFDTCLQCHNTPQSREKCTPCHQGGPTKIVTWHGMPFSHENHAKHGIDCTTCHTELKAHGGIALTPQECNACHGVSMPHPDDFTETHGALFKEHKLDLDTCSTCHKGGMPGEFCQTCHG
ncbi:MAG: hypothetical protein GXP48_05730 [Acidobacteria bacterium]|nr:hypothetical protein [Acidobacteriota bacterium]